MSLFTPPPSDLSVRFFNKIFGVGWHTLYNGGHITGSTTALAAMFHVFNSVILAGLSLYFIYVFTTGVAGTAHEGTPLGKKYHSVKAPFRAATSTALLAPLPWLKGFCLLQALVLMFIYYGIGAADHVWDAGVKWLDNHPAQVSAQGSLNVLPQADRIFQSLVIRQYLMQQQGYKSAGKPTWKKRKSTENNLYGSKTRRTRTYREHWQLTYPLAKKLGLKPDALGVIEVSCPKEGSGKEQCSVEKEAVNAMIDKLSPAAAALVKYHSGKKTSNAALPAYSGEREHRFRRKVNTGFLNASDR